MIWKVTGWPLRLYQVGGFLTGITIGLHENVTWVIVGVLYGLFGLLLFHTGKKIPWTVGYENWETWLHVSIFWQIIGAITGIVITFL